MHIQRIPNQAIPFSASAKSRATFSPDIQMSDPIQFGNTTVPTKKTGIVSTLGPASDSPEIIKALIEAGVNIFRLNFSHGTQEAHGQRIEWIRQAEATLKAEGKLKPTDPPIKILADIQGAKIRVGKFPAGSLELKPDESVYFSPDPNNAQPDVITMTLPGVVESLQPGQRILMDEGRLEVVVEEALNMDELVRCKIIRGGTLLDSKGLNFPHMILKNAGLTEKDRGDIDYALSQNVDYLAISFVQSAADIDAVRALVDKHPTPNKPQIIAKIERPGSSEEPSLSAISNVADGIMVARGDLGIETDPVDVPALQERIIKTTKAQNKPVIVATQMLESMLNSTVPSRSDISDIADAVKDGADYVMLSGETAMGKYPVEAVKMMNRVTQKYQRENNPTSPSLIEQFQNILLACQKLMNEFMQKLQSLFYASSYSSR